MKKSAQIIRKSRLTANLPTVLDIDNDKLMMINLFTESEGHQLNWTQTTWLDSRRFLHFCAKFSGEKVFYAQNKTFQSG